MEKTTNINSKLNALDSLKRIAHELDHRQDDKENPLRLKGVIAWSWHTVALLAYLRLLPGRQLFDAWIQDYLHKGTPDLDVERDARWEERERLSLLELLDILSEKELPSLKPEFYHGWQDRTSRCQWLRGQVHELIGTSISETERRPLLLLLAVYHRLIRLPAGVDLDSTIVVESLPALFALIELLIDQEWPEAEDLQQALNRCRQALQ